MLQRAPNRPTLTRDQRHELVALIEAFEASGRESFSVKIANWPGDGQVWLQLGPKLLVVVNETGKSVGLPLLQKSRGAYKDRADYWEQCHLDAMFVAASALREQLAAGN